MPDNNTAEDRLRLHIEAIEKMEEEKKGISDDISDRYKLAKGEGYDVPAMKQIVKIRRMLPENRRELDMILDTYKCALGID